MSHLKFKHRLDRKLIRSSTRNGSSRYSLCLFKYFVLKFTIKTRLAKKSSKWIRIDWPLRTVLDFYTLFLSTKYMGSGDMHLVLPALNVMPWMLAFWLMVQKVRLMIFSLNMVDYCISFLLLSTWILFWPSTRGNILKLSLLGHFGCVSNTGWLNKL